MRRPFWLAPAALLAACEVTPTQLLVFVDSDLDPQAGEIDGFRIWVRGPGGQEVTLGRDVYSLADVTLPASFGVAPKDRDADRTVEVEVGAMLDGQVLFTTRARTRYVEHEVERLDLFLARRCRTESIVCERLELTCDDSGCRDPDVDLEDQGGGDPFDDPGPAEWAVVFPDEPAALPEDYEDSIRVALDSRRNVVVGGTFSGVVDIGTERFEAEDRGGFVTAISPDGSGVVWQTGFVPTQDPADEDGHVVVRGIAVDLATDRTFVVGSFAGAASLAGADETSVGQLDGFVAVLDDHGVLEDHTVLAHVDSDIYPEDVVVGPEGEAVVVGSFGYDLQLGDVLTLRYEGDQQNLFLGRWDGAWRWGCGREDEDPSGVALASDGSIRVSGVTSPDPLTGIEAEWFLDAVDPTSDNDDCEVSAFHSLGGFAGGPPRVDVGPEDRVVWVGGIAGAQLDGGNELDDPIGNIDGLVVSFDGDDSFGWRRYVGHADTGDDLHDLVFDRYGTTFVVGSITGDAEVEEYGHVLTYRGGEFDGIAAAFAADGTVVWARSFGGGGWEHASGIAYDASTGAVILVGHASGQAARRVFGTEPIPNGVFVYRFVP